MRPRHEAADDRDLGRYVQDRMEASMRPRHEAADDPGCRSRRHPLLGASMRPRHEAADDHGKTGLVQDRLPRFNEAAARSRG